MESDITDFRACRGTHCTSDFLEEEIIAKLEAISPEDKFQKFSDVLEGWFCDTIVMVRLVKGFAYALNRFLLVNICIHGYHIDACYENFGGKVFSSSFRRMSAVPRT